MKKPSQATNQVTVLSTNRKHCLLWLLCSFFLVPAICQASTVATPTFSPAAGTYTSIQTVTINDSTSGATIYYTTDGSTPTTSSTQYNGTITVSTTETVKAIGTKTGFTKSAVGSAAYTIHLTVATPTFSPAAGAYSSAQTVTINDATSGAAIYYTINGSTPTTSSTQYTGPITVSSSETVKAIATATGYSQSAVGSASYTIGVPQIPSFVQGNTTGATSSASTIAYTNNVAAGDALYCFSFDESGPNHSNGCADSQGNTWNTVASVSLASDGDTVTLACAVAGASGPNTVTFNVNGATAAVFGGIYQVHNSTCTLDGALAKSNTTGASACNSGSLTTSTVNDLLVGVCGAGTWAMQPGGGWSDALTMGLDGYVVALGELQVASTTGSYTATSTAFSTSLEQAALRGGVPANLRCTADGDTDVLAGGRHLQQRADGDDQRCDFGSGDLLHHRRLDSDHILDTVHRTDHGSLFGNTQCHRRSDG